MTIPRLKVRVNTGTWQQGIVTAAAGDTVSLAIAAESVQMSGSIEIYGAPIAYTMPTGWTDLGDGIWTHQATAQAVTITLGADWGDFLVRLRTSPTNGPIYPIDPATSVTDESTIIRVPSAGGVVDVWDPSPSDWRADVRKDLRLLTASGGAAVPWNVLGTDMLPSEIIADASVTFTCSGTGTPLTIAATAAGASWHELLNIDFTVETPAGLATDGTYTIAGETFYVENSARAISPMNITAAGLYIPQDDGMAPTTLRWRQMPMIRWALPASVKNNVPLRFVFQTDQTPVYIGRALIIGVEYPAALTYPTVQTPRYALAATEWIDTNYSYGTVKFLRDMTQNYGGSGAASDSSIEEGAMATTSTFQETPAGTDVFGLLLPNGISPWGLAKLLIGKSASGCFADLNTMACVQDSATTYRNLFMTVENEGQAENWSLFMTAVHNGASAGANILKVKAEAFY